jgi:integrase
MLFKWAIGRGDIEANPLDGMPSPQAATSRDRVLSDEELALALRAAAKIEAPFGPFYQMLFATGQRREEVAGLDWSEVDGPGQLWTLPAERAKNGEASLIPLNRHAMAVLSDLAPKNDQGETKWPRRGLVFTTTGETPISGYSRAKARLDAKMLELARKDAEEAGDDPDTIELAPWRLHDARRTVATALQRLGVRFEVTEAILNHTAGASRSGVAAVYQRHGWGPEKRAALDAWAAHCDAVLSPPADQSNVVPMHGATSSTA